MLRCAAALHEIGMAVSHEGHHRHGEYIVRHADAAGFAVAAGLGLALYTPAGRWSAIHCVYSIGPIWLTLADHGNDFV